MSYDDFAPRLAMAVARHIGAPGTVHDLQRLTGGAIKTTWSFAADIGGERQRFIVQLSGGIVSEAPTPSAEGPNWASTERDARVMLAAVNAGVPAPRVRAILDEADGIGPGYITEWVAGETLGPRIVREERFAPARALMAAQCGRILADIHRIAVDEVTFLNRFDPAQLLANRRQIVDFYGLRLPALEFGLRWVGEHLPEKVHHTVVHGDFRTGNLIVDETEGIRCVLDWEVAHVGDPMLDLGWLCVKTWRFSGQPPVGGFGSREELFAAYEHASGHAVDPARVRFWEAFGCVKWAVDCLQIGMHGVEEVGIERSAVGRRIEEPLWDFLNLVEERD